MTARTDDQIRNDVMAELAWEPRVQTSALGVLVRSGVVTLTGTVDSCARRWAAEDAAYRVAGVKAVANDLHVKLPAEARRPDAEITEAARKTLESCALLDAGDFDVDVADGWVTLKGQVTWHFEREEAERAIRHLWGVKGVTDLVSVKPGATPDKLKHEIERALLRNTEDTGIVVDVQGSKVILKGQVRAWAERQRARRVAWMAPGVTQVEDQLVVA